LPWIECGDAVMAYTRLNTVRAFVLSRTLKGIQALSDSFSADTDQYQPIYKPTVQTQISQTNTALAQTNSNVTSVDNRVTGVDSRVTGVDGRVTQLGTVVAQKANITDLNATNANVSNLSASVANLGTVVAQKANISDLNATNARVGSLESNSVRTYNFSTYYANTARVYSGSMSASTMSCDSITARYSASILGQAVSWKSAYVTFGNGTKGYINYLGH